MENDKSTSKPLADHLIFQCWKLDVCDGVHEARYNSCCWSNKQIPSKYWKRSL